MNFVFISPNFPAAYWNFCDRLNRNGVDVYAISDAPYDLLDGRLKACLKEYYRVGSLEDYDQVYRGFAYLSFRHGRMDWVESMNEYWLELDARLRTDFDIATGVKSDAIACMKRKSLMKEGYRKAGVPSARQIMVSDRPAAEAFIREVGYPVIVKPDIGVGASNTYKLSDPAQLDDFFSHKPDVPYVMEEFITGNIYSYDAIVDSRGDPLFENMTAFPPSIMDMAAKDQCLDYAVCPDVAPQLRERGRAVLKAFGVVSRFVHFEFFRLPADRPPLGKAGDFIGLEVNMRPPGGYTPDMMDYAHSLDVFQIWADMVTADRRIVPDRHDHQYCVYCGRKLTANHRYRRTHQQIMARYGGVMKLQLQMAPIDWPVMGRMMYTARLPEKSAVHDFIHFVLDEEDFTVDDIPLP
jgi:hypothetical protein